MSVVGPGSSFGATAGAFAPCCIRDLYDRSLRTGKEFVGVMGARLTC
jgi:hypothetical protein